ncbi:MAG: hypothetical protein V4713_03970 [Pseudomonadota bacterium]
MRILWIVVALVVAGCASSQPRQMQTLFDSKYTNGSAYVNHGGCDVRANCDLRDTVIAFETDGKVAGLRLTQGPKAVWHDSDYQNHLKVMVSRQGGVPLIQIERVGVDFACVASVQSDADMALSLSIPSCGGYPAIRSTWRMMTPFELAMEQWQEHLALLMQMLTGGELP